MKKTQIALVCLTLLVAGCFMAPSPYGSQLKPIASRYGSVKKGSQRSEVEELLGKPTLLVEDASVWETRFDKLNFTRVKVWFDDQDKVVKVETTTGHGTSGPGYSASGESSWTR